ncbi:Plasmodium exported protein, unknown function [Plasmodium gonderi]|uniref:Uncharacterized protein n=1 Tax=Plasmodium gonderi TaxID=77519 RepID=A0A1Y1JL19_PLAGO|nr:Plasmodium exported protein, unknown function [Plasmodium gonderi]GAW83226.1 Plasmodium exported protein, unknown function [Plasmodium gonderi]
MADTKTLSNEQSKKGKMNSILFYSKIFACTLLIWASQCTYNNEYTEGGVVYSALNRSLSENAPRRNFPQGTRGPYMQEGVHDQQHPSTSHGMPQASTSAPASDLNIDIEKKLKDLKDVVWDKVENAVEWKAIADSVKDYVNQVDVKIESKLFDTVNRANNERRTMQNPDISTRAISTFSQNYTIITPPLLLLTLSILTSDRCKRHFSNILLTAVLVTLTYIFFKLKKMDDNKK